MAVLLPAFVTLLLLLSEVSAGRRRGKGHDSSGEHAHSGEHDSDTDVSSQTPITIEVINSVNPGLKKTYSTTLAFRGILLGGMKKLQQTNSNFTFTYSENQDYGPFLESINGLAGDFSQRTFWLLQVKKPDGKVITPDVGIGCYIPSANDKIIFTYTTY